MGRKERRQENSTGRQGLGEESKEASRTGSSAGPGVAESDPQSRPEASESHSEFLHVFPIQRVREISVDRGY